MTIEEFKAWLEGFSESFPDGAPTKAQWEKIKQKINTVGSPMKRIGNGMPIFGG
jgi:hypothetical protein